METERKEGGPLAAATTEIGKVQAADGLQGHR